MKKIFIIILTALSMSLVLPEIIFGKTGFSQGQPQGNANETQGKNKAVIGTVDKVAGSKIEMNDIKENKKVNLELDAKTKIYGASQKLLKSNSVKLKDMIAVVSTESGGTATDGAKIRKISKVYIKEASSSAQLKRRAVSGVISAVAGNTITLTHQIQRDRTYTVIVTNLTRISLKGNKVGTLADLVVGTRIAAVGDLVSGGGISAKLIHVIPGKATGVFNKNPLATPGPVASISATPTVTATISATPTTLPTLTITPTVQATATPTLTITPTATP